MNKRNKVNINSKNKALMSLINNPKQLLVVDANFFIPPDRSRERLRPISFKKFESIWLEHLIDTFNPIIIHEAVYEEFQTKDVKDFVDNCVKNIPQLVNIVKDSDLDDNEQFLRNSIEERIAKYTNYEPSLDNKDDRGEVKSLSYMVVKNLVYFCSHDANSIKLIEESEKLENNLDDVMAIRTYEIIYYFIKNNIGDRDQLRSLYKYMYYFTTSDKKINPSWQDFKEGMDKLYKNI